MANLSSTTVHGDLSVTGDAQIDHILLASDSPTDIQTTSWNTMSWNTTEINDTPYSFDGTTVTIEQDGTYEIVAEMDFTSSGGSRENPNIRITQNGSQVGVMGRSGYMRDAEGHNHASSHARTVITANGGDTITADAVAEAETAGSYSPDNSQLYIKRLHR